MRCLHYTKIWKSTAKCLIHIDPTPRNGQKPERKCRTREPPRHWPDGRAAPHWTPERLFTLFPNLGEMPERPGGRMSGGEQQMLTVARTLMGQPLLVLLDEPSEGVAPLIVEQMADTIRALKDQGVGVLLSEQNLHFAAAVADRAYVLEKGQIRHQGPMAALVADEAVRQAFFGV